MILMSGSEEEEITSFPRGCQNLPSEIGRDRKSFTNYLDLLEDLVLTPRENH